jgi:hypothetical protein
MPLLLDDLPQPSSMKLLLDECLPRKLKNHIPGHECRTVPECGWAGKKNGELLLFGGEVWLRVVFDT